jgi:hypothetical protein
MDGWVGGWVDGWMDGWVGGWMDRRDIMNIIFLILHWKLSLNTVE